MISTEQAPADRSAHQDDAAAAAAWLLTPKAVREQCGLIFEAGLRGELVHFSVDPSRLPAAANLVVGTIKDNYPTLDIPPHARWRHFVVDGIDRAASLMSRCDDDARERLRARFELAITSVLLDAGAGPAWRYRDPATGRDLARSEGLAVASLDLFAAGAFSSDANRRLQADAEGLSSFNPGDLARGFQVSAENPLEGLEGRAGLLCALGQTVAGTPQIFSGTPPRLGTLADHLLGLTHGDTIDAATILGTVLEALGPIWPGRLELAGINLGDTWHHRLARRDDAATGFVPFHKLSQWLTYSLFEPLAEYGLRIANQDALTGLAEYRNGGLFIDTGVLTARSHSALDVPQRPDSELVVEWRALTVALIDRVADLVRERLELTPKALPLASVLEGGTWGAGRRIANKLRPGGPPPITIVSDGSVF